MRRWFYKSSGLLVSAFFVYLAVRQVDLSESMWLLGTVRPGWLVVAVLVYLSNFPLRALRWRRILWNQKALPFQEVLVPVLVGHMANNVLPARSGEIYRAHFLGVRAQMSRSGAMGSIIVERTLDGLMLVVVILLVFLLFPQTHFLGVMTLLTGLVFLSFAAGILLCSLSADRTNKIMDQALGLRPGKLRRFVGLRLGFFLRGIRGVTTIRDYLEAGVYTVLIWMLEASAIALVIVSFGVSLPLSGYFLVFALAALGTTLPAGPGYVGPYQYAFVLALGVFAISSEAALAISVAAQLALFGSITMVGLTLLWREQLRPKPSLPSRKKPALRKQKVG